MKNHRIGNDIKVRWAVVKNDGAAFSLEGLDIKLYLRSALDRIEVTGFSVLSNVISWTFFGKDQKHLGKYSLELVINEGSEGMITSDTGNFIRLVSCSCKTSDTDEPNVTTETIDLLSELDLISMLVDNKLSTTSENPVQNKVITTELNKKANKNEIPTKLSELEDDLDFSNYLPREEFEERIEGYATSDSVQEIRERVDDNDILIDDLYDIKIDKEADDYYPQLSVGVADNLAGVDDVSRVFTYDRAGGGVIADGVARVTSIKGNSVVWNQLTKPSVVATWEHGGWFSNNSSFAVEKQDNTYIINANGNSVMLAQQVKLIRSHRYLAIYGLSIEGNTTGGYYTGYISAPTRWFDSIDIAEIKGTRKDFNKFFEVDSEEQEYIFMGAYGATIDKLIVYNPILIDLTRMYGQGNEPTTIEEFNKRIPMGIDLYAYNEGEVIDMNVQGIKSVGRNVWDEEWRNGYYENGVFIAYDAFVANKNAIRIMPNVSYYYNAPEGVTMSICYYDVNMNYIGEGNVLSNTQFTAPYGAAYANVRFGSNYGTTYKNDICIGISGDWEGYYPHIEASEDLSIVGKYFPNGMRSAGSAHDEIRYNKATNRWEKVQRIGEVDMGTLGWFSYQPTEEYNLYYSEMFAAHYDNEGLNLVCARYAAAKVWGDTILNTQCRIFVEDGGRVRIYIRDDAYTDAAAFKAAMRGVMLYYELAEPIITPIEEKDFNLDYKVQDCGTEQAIAEGKSSALSANITYGFNAVGLIKQLRSLVETMQAKLNNL